MENYGYFRILSLNKTATADRQKLLDEGIAPNNIYSDPFAPKDIERIELKKMKNKVQPGDLVVISQMIHLGNSVADMLNLINEFFALGVNLHVLDVGRIDDGPAAQMVIKALESARHVEQIRSYECYNYMKDTHQRVEAEGSRIIRKLQREGIKDKVIDMLSVDHKLAKVARELGVSRGAIYRWQQALIQNGDLVMAKKKDSPK